MYARGGQKKVCMQSVCVGVNEDYSELCHLQTGGQVCFQNDETEQVKQHK